MDLDGVLFLDALPRLAAAVGSNLRIAIIAILFALIGGTALTLLRTVRLKPLSRVIGIVIGFIRGTPILVQIFLFYYGLPVLHIDLAPITAGICAIAFNSTIFITEIMRAGLADMDPGPIEAAIVLGLRKHVIWTRVVLPQLYIRVLPPLVNEMTVIVKATTLLSVITVVEVLRTAQQIGNTAFRPLEPILAAAAVLFVVNFTISRGGRLIESRLANRRG